MANLSYLTRTIKGYRVAVCKVHKAARLLDVIARNSSVLYISGKRANKTFSYLTPYLDIDEQLSNIDALERNLTSRHFKKKASEYVKLWEFYKLTAQDVNKLEYKVKEIGSSLQKYYENKNMSKNEQQEFEKFKTQLSIAKEDYKSMRDTLWDLDERIIEQLMKLPNNLDEKTPLDCPVVIKTVGVPCSLNKESTKCHTEIGKRLNLLEYKNPMECYLLNEATLFELGLVRFAGQILAQNEMLNIAGLDFARSFIVEASGLDHENLLDSFVVKNDDETSQNENQLHLVGSASLISFLSMHAKQHIQARDFPAKYYTTGRQYVPLLENITPAGLYTLCQTTSVQAFTLVKSEKPTDYYDEFNNLVNNVCTLYDNICDHYRIVLKPAPQLATAETMRLSFELWSPFLGQYVEVGHVSKYDTYLSKRLLITYQSTTGRAYPKVISGTVLSVHRLLACLLEQDPNKFSIPAKIAECVPGAEL